MDKQSRPDKKTYKYIDKQTDKQNEKQTDKQSKHTDKQSKHTDKKIYKLAVKQAHREAHIRTDRQANTELSMARNILCLKYLKLSLF